jgi:hypothetical protein
MKTALLAGYLHGVIRISNLGLRPGRGLLMNIDCTNQPWWLILNHPPEHFASSLDFEHPVAIRTLKCALGK